MKSVSTALFGFLVLIGFSNAQAYSSIAEDMMKAYFASPMALVPGAGSSAQINLLKWNENPQDPPTPTERYNRLNHFGEWITLAPNDCVDVRNRVLIRDSLKPVQMRPAAPCKVGLGAWYDPYTSKTFENSTEVQIDHFVPLKDVYINGAWKWNFQQRCTYANYMGFRDHLKPVSGPENMFKSDHSPSDYMPPNPDYKCEYLKTWLTIKLIWKLGMQRAEAAAIKQLVAENKCDPSQFVFSTADLREQRATLVKLLPVCPEVPPPSNFPKPQTTTAH
jgi:hypothetical protein